MLFSFLTRFISSKPEQLIVSEPDDNSPLKNFVLSEGGKIFHNFQLFYRDSVTSIDTVIFLPNFGIFLGETLNWQAQELENATVERSSKRIKRPSSTHLENSESTIRRKLEDVLSFDSTPCKRFIWMRYLTEAEFDSLDPSFHALLPKEHLLFSTESAESVKNKLYSIGEYRREPYSGVKILGALNTHTFILPTHNSPAGALLSPQQTLFLTSNSEGSTTLLGGYGSGKSTLVVRKVLLHILSHPNKKIVIVTPNILGGELLRNELVSLIEYGALSIDVSALTFYAPTPFETGEIDRLEELKAFQDASLLVCDDAHLFEEGFIEKLHKKRGKRTLLCTSIVPLQSDTTFTLSGRFRRTPSAKEIASPYAESIIILLLQLRKILARAQPLDLLIAVSDEQEAIYTKEAIDEYFDLNCRVLSSSFSLQYQDLDSILITPIGHISPLSRAHVILRGIDPSDRNYSRALSRASETLTIISYTNSDKEMTNG